MCVNNDLILLCLVFFFLIIGYIDLVGRKCLLIVLFLFGIIWGRLSGIGGYILSFLRIIVFRYGKLIVDLKYILLYVLKLFWIFFWSLSMIWGVCSK